MGYASWTYFRTFTLTEEDFKGKSVWLKCDGLDTVANIRFVLIRAVILVLESILIIGS